MNELREAAKKALIVLQCIDYDSFDTVVSGPDKYMCDDAYDELRAALAQPEPMLNGLIEEETNASASVRGLTRPTPEYEPVAYQWLGTSVIRKRVPKTAEADAWQPLYTHPPQRKHERK